MVKEKDGPAIAPGDSAEELERPGGDRPDRVIWTRFFYIFTGFLTVDCVSKSELGVDFPAVWPGNLLNFVRLEAISLSVLR